ncbi:MAG: PilT/PilU family type 4a pilus ATPase [Pseudomonadota bacterium]
MEREQASKLVRDLLRQMVITGASDMFITAEFPPAMKIDGKIRTVSETPLRPEESNLIVRTLMNDKQSREFDATREANFAMGLGNIRLRDGGETTGRYRVSAFVQQGNVGAVVRTINTRIPSFEELDLPAQLRDIVMTKRGLVLVVGGTGSGKSTTLAAMIGHRNQHTRGHIITIEDPIEFVHPHSNSVVTQREVGVDTDNWHTALKNTLRQAPDVILIGEIRDQETMQYAVQFAETGHLCLATLHANNANQALDRIVNFFPEERRPQLLMDMSLNMRAIVSQRLLARESGQGRVAAMEILLSSPLVADLIHRGEFHKIKEVMKKSTRQGMMTFDQSLFGLFEDRFVSEAEAMRNADSKNELRLRIKLESKRADRSHEGGPDLDLEDEDDGTGMLQPRRRRTDG